MTEKVGRRGLVASWLEVRRDGLPLVKVTRYKKSTCARASGVLATRCVRCVRWDVGLEQALVITMEKGDVGATWRSAKEVVRQGGDDAARDKD